MLAEIESSAHSTATQLPGFDGLLQWRHRQITSFEAKELQTALERSGTLSQGMQVNTKKLGFTSGMESVISSGSNFSSTPKVVKPGDNIQVQPFTFTELSRQSNPFSDNNNDEVLIAPVNSSNGNSYSMELSGSSSKYRTQVSELLQDIDRANKAKYDAEIEQVAEHISSVAGDRLRGLIRSGVITPVTSAIVNYAAGELMDWVEKEYFNQAHDQQTVTGVSSGDVKEDKLKMEENYEPQYKKVDNKGSNVTDNPLGIKAGNGKQIGFVDNTDLLPEVRVIKQKINELKKRVPSLTHRNEQIHAKKKIEIYQGMIEKHRQYLNHGILAKNFQGFVQRHIDPTKDNALWNIRFTLDSVGLLTKSGIEAIDHLSDQYLTEYKADSFAVLSMAKDRGVKSIKNMLGDQGLAALTVMGQKGIDLSKPLWEYAPTLYPGEKESLLWFGGGVSTKVMSSSVSVVKKGLSITAVKTQNRLEKVFAERKVVKKRQDSLQKYRTDIKQTADSAPLKNAVPENVVQIDKLKTEYASKMAKPVVKDEKLEKIVKRLYRPDPEPIGTGSSSAALRNEVKTGELTKGRFHLQKTQESAQRLRDWIKNNTNNSVIDKNDIQAAENLLRDLEDALKYKG